jgi:peroxiredoxin
MTKRWIGCFLLVALAGWALYPAAHANKVGGNLGTKVADFTLADVRTGRAVALADFKDKKAVAVVFVGTQCPINNAFLPRLVELHKQFSAKGVQVLAVNSNEQDTAAEAAFHAKEAGLPFPVLDDAKNAVADQFGAARTPEAFVLDAERVVRYRGRISDQFGIGYQRVKATREDLAEALAEVLAGKPVTVATTPVEGCKIGRAVAAKEGGEVTYTKHVARILQKNCQECHRPGQIGPFALLSYDDAKAWAETIEEVVTEGRMPPWYADPHFGKFANDRRLPPGDREALLAWIKQGMPKGDDKDLPEPAKFADGWTIGEPDAVITMPREFEVPAEMPPGGVEYKYFRVPTNFTEDKWVVRAQAKPGVASVVHHIIIFIVPPGQRFAPDRPGAVLCGTAPGDMPLRLEPGLAKKVPAGSQFVFQMHYTPNGTAAKDRSSVGLVFAKQPPERRVLTRPIDNRLFTTRLQSIPPGAENHQIESEYTFSEDGHVISFMPHMHLRGKDFRIEAIYPDGKTQTLLSIPRYYFGWQSVYRFAEPVKAPKGTKIHCVAHFDNSAKNPNNPDPTKRVYWGDQTWEEMMIGWMDYYFDKKAE